ncbi:MAG TPA: hypothetical protein VFD91_09040 [Mariniphaga sp.]|nr:hypothetical protein [Mariniphaga sp.]
MKKVKSNTEIIDPIDNGGMAALATICYKLHLYIDHYHIFYADGFIPKYLNPLAIEKDGMAIRLAKCEQ